jgi:multidrug resistance efflux pump
VQRLTDVADPHADQVSISPTARAAPDSLAPDTTPLGRRARVLNAPPPVVPRPADTPGPARPRLRRALRILGSIAVFGLGIAFLLDRYLDLKSSNAALSATTITLRVPVEGELTSLPLQVGEIAGDGESLATIHNDRVDDRNESELITSLAVAEQESQALDQRQRALNMRMEEAQQHAADFRVARKAQLASQLGAEEAAIAGAQARAQEAGMALHRAQALFASGVESAASLDQARREQGVAQSELAAARRQREVAASVLNAAGSGVFGTDNATDRSTSQQALDQLRTAGDDLQVQRTALSARITGLRDKLEAERSRLAKQRDVVLSARAQVRVLRLLASRGEYLHQGQEIATLADCHQPIVIATVAESVFRSLRLGMAARFTAAGDPELRTGRIVELAPPVFGPGSIPSYGVTLRLDTSPADDLCEVGRIGSVHFGA